MIESAQKPRSIVLIGPMAVGKTTLGAELARQLDREFRDSDQAIEKQYGRISEIFASRGESWFRQVEARTIAGLLALAEPYVLSLGGGAVLDTGTQQLLRGHTVVYLSATVDDVRARILRSTTRPLLQGEDAVQRWQKLAEARQCVYQRLATVTLPVKGRNAQELAKVLLAQLDDLKNVEQEEIP
ncbi:shikimate kinase [Psychromicrobium sp. YIM B11713]|uniref:shikimate kinase n=1 Tax=Psychromicrobium sp. YIM B11713 TaxID=3145233 RepID=UPI00374F99DB